jgi:hypothetical protein
MVTIRRKLLAECMRNMVKRYKQLKKQSLDTKSKVKSRKTKSDDSDVIRHKFIMFWGDLDIQNKRVKAVRILYDYQMQ